MDKEQEMFENWIVKELNLTKKPYHNGKSYHDFAIQLSWDSWQARAALLPTVAEIESVLEHEFRTKWTDWEQSKKDFVQAIHKLMDGGKS